MHTVNRPSSLALVLTVVLFLLVPGITAHAGSSEFVARVTARDAAVVDSSGARWQPRDASWGTSRLSSSLVGKDVAGTQDDVLYQVSAVSAVGARVAVPSSGSYRVRVLTADGWWSQAGKRVFSVSAQRGAVSRTVDIAGAVGQQRAYDVVFDVDVVDGVLDLVFTQIVDVSIVAGVEVRRVGDVVASPKPQPTATSTPTTLAPTTSAPTTTPAPTTSAPTTSAPTTSAPTTSAPTTPVPTTSAPTPTSTSPATTTAATPSASTPVAPSTAGSVAPTPTTSGSSEFVARVTARDAAVVDSSGARWQPRDASWGTSRLSSSLVGKDVAGTQDDVLYQVSAVSAVGARVAVPSSGSYRVRVLTADGWWSQAGKRVFSVSAQRGAVSRTVDIAGAVGQQRAYDVVFDVDVVDGVLDLVFTQIVDVSIVAGVEVRRVGDVVASPKPQPTQPSDPQTSPSPDAPPTTTTSPSPSTPPTGDVEPSATPTLQPSPTATPTPTDAPQTFAFRMTAGRAAKTDTAGNTWQPLGVNLGGVERSEAFTSWSVLGTADPDLYTTSIWGTRGVVVPVPAPGTYRVRLLFSSEPWSQPGQRVIDVTAEGTALARSLDVTATVGAQQAYDVIAPVRVEDGALTVGVTATVGNPLIAGVEVTSTDPAVGAVPDVARPLVDLGPQGVYSPRVDTAAVAPNSAATVALIAADVASRYGGIAAVNAFQYNASIYRVDPGQARIDVGFHDCQNRGVVPDGLYDGAAHFTGVPVPSHAAPANGTDGEMTIYDPASDTVWEFWQMRKNAVTGRWEACWGGRIDGASTSGGVFPAPFGVSASGLVMAGGVISIEEAMRGRIDHAMVLGVIDAHVDPSWPATRTDGGSVDPNIVREGQRLRLDPSIDVATLGLTPFGEMVARAAQQYGFVVADRAGAVGVSTESGRSVKERTGSDPWEVLLGAPSYATLKGFPWDRLQALPLDYGRPAAG